MTTRITRFAGLVLLLLLIGPALIGCGSGASADQPPTIRYGKDVCSRCNMIISEEKFASGLVAKDGKSRVFDDTGEMIASIQKEGLSGSIAWVHDYDTTKWIHATEASYVVSKDVVTPMGSGVVAFAAKPSADQFAAAHSGSVMTWDEMLTKWQWQMKGGMH